MAAQCTNALQRSSSKHPISSWRFQEGRTEGFVANPEMKRTRGWKAKQYWNPTWRDDKADGGSARDIDGRIYSTGSYTRVKSGTQNQTIGRPQVRFRSVDGSKNSHCRGTLGARDLARVLLNEELKRLECARITHEKPSEFQTHF
jgi:hypothetical protein